MSEKKQSLIPGIILIGIGIILLSPGLGRGIDWWDHVVPIFIILLSIAFLTENIWHHNKKSLFWGVVLIVIGTFYTLRNFDVIPYYYIDEYWPLFLFAPGLGSLIQNLAYKDEGRKYSTATILISMSVVFFFFTLPYDFDLIEGFLSKFWPAFLILIGLLFILTGLKRPQNEEIEESDER
ncbi:hypothetical protein DRQ07_02335 [candidate division KSB1 bacterium]|nr:MAG: hypothetical protein DRQ07_02335 [candidate division KSB1 bacterium]